MLSEDNGAAWNVRAARNQSLFRAINEELKVAIHALDPESLTIACECADPACVETLEVDAEQYAQVRAQPTHFIVLRGHIYPEVERVVFEDTRFQIVEKIDEAALVAAAAYASASSA